MSIESAASSTGSVASPVASPVDESLSALDRLAESPVADHPAVFEAIHRVLRDRLANPSGTHA